MVDALATWLLNGLSRFFAQASFLHTHLCKVEDCTRKCAKWKIAQENVQSGRLHIGQSRH
jgi:hypothetical protein